MVEPQGAKRKASEEVLERAFEGSGVSSFSIEFAEDKIMLPDSIHSETRAFRSKTLEAISKWDQPLTKGEHRNAVLVVAFYVDLNVAWDSKSDFLLARLVGLILGNELRAHPNSVYNYHNGGWVKTAQLTPHQIRHVELTLNIARYVFSHLIEKNVTRASQDVMAFCQGFAKWDEYKPVEDFESNEDHWAQTPFKVLKDIPWRMGKAGGAKQTGALDCFAQWFQLPMPDPSPTVAFTNACLEHRGRAEGDILATKKKGENNDCYVYIPIGLDYKVNENCRERMKKALDAAYAGNPRARGKIMLAEALSLFGLYEVQRCNFITGIAANSKSMLSDLRANLFQENHSFISAAVFEIDEEFRKQACGFAYARCLTVQEVGHAIKLKTDIFKKVCSGEKLAARYNYGKETYMFDWKRSAFFWEVNKEVPHAKVQDAEKEDTWKPFLRRINIIKLLSVFTSNEDEVDHDKNVYMEDPSLRVFFTSPDGRFTYLFDHILPLVEKFKLEAALDLLNNPNEQEKADAKEFVRAMVRAGQEEKRDEMSREEWENVLLLAHENTAHKEVFVKSYVIQKLDCIPGSAAATSTDKKPSRVDNFRKAVAVNPVLFEFDVTRNGFRRLLLDVRRFNSIISTHGQQFFGGSAQQLPSVFEIRRNLAKSNAKLEVADIFCASQCTSGKPYVATQMAGDEEVHHLWEKSV